MFFSINVSFSSFSPFSLFLPFQVSLQGAATPHGEESANSEKPPPSAKATPRRGSSWLPHMLRDEGRKSRADEDEERDLELVRKKRRN